ncbi:MAG: hypothetical protein U1E05_10240, partial [Patescibacteria group bacterium]|nr:hypothetical protein [Patescibacteria group bacterium]
LDEPNVLGLRFRKARAGIVPLPMGSIVEQIEKASRDWELKLTWRQTDGDPVALITLPETLDDGRVLRLEHVEVRDGEFHAAGSGK